jgi:hypothetical protein
MRSVNVNDFPTVAINRNVVSAARLARFSSHPIGAMWSPPIVFSMLLGPNVDSARVGDCLCCLDYSCIEL